jgi:hypothetical protein
MDTTANDTFFGSQWSLLNTGQQGGRANADIHATQAWALTTGNSNVVVAVIDSGVDYHHPDLQQNLWIASAPFPAFDINGSPITCPAGSRGFNAILGTCDPMDDNGADGSGATSAAIECLEVIKGLKDSGVNIVVSNNSWGGNDFSQALEDAIAANMSDGILFVAAAGNDYVNNDIFPTYPADSAVPNVIAVAATDRLDNLATFSNVGQHTVHLGAPGVEILSTTPNNTYSVLSGTSMATPHVTGVAALLKAQDPTRDWRTIKNLLLAGGDNDSALSGTITSKRLNAYGSMTCGNSTIYSRLQPTVSVTSAALGQPFTISAVNINCAAPAGSLQVAVSPGNQTITLHDDGSAPDSAAGDGIYTGAFTPTALGDYTLTFPKGDVVQVSVLSNYGPLAQTSSTYRTFTGTNLNLGDDDIATVTSPFPISFGGGSFSQMYVSSNGMLSFTNAFGEYANAPLPIPVGATPARDLPVVTLVAPFWQDLFPVKGTNQNVFWGVNGTAPNRELIVEWRDVRSFACRTDSSATVTFQVVFQEGSSNVQFNYADTVFGGDCVAQDGGGIATVGIQVAPGLGTDWSYSQPSVGSGSALVWQTPPPTEGSNPAPTLTSISPASAVLGSPAFTLTLTGTNFVPGSYMIWASNARSATYLSSTELQATISPADVSLYNGSGPIQVVVMNPPPGGGSSASLPFTLNSPGPIVTSLSPASAIAGGFGFVLSVAGTNFVPGSQLLWNGQTRQTFVQAPTLLNAVITDVDIATAGTASISVSNPAPGGGTSNVISFSIGVHPALAAGLMIRPSTPPLPGMRVLPTNKPTRFLGWNLASRFGPEYLQYFNRPRADIAFDPPKVSVTDTTPSLLAGNPLPLPGFQFRNTLPADFIPSGVATGDFNRDGHIDWVVANGGSNSLWIYLGKGDGTSQLPTILPLRGQSPVAVAVADLRGTGVLDIIVAEADSGTIGVFLGSGNGTFQPEQEYFVPGPPLTLAVADVNKDGHADVVVGTVSSPQVNGFVTFLGDGTGNLGFPVTAPPPNVFAPVTVQAMALADFNHDGLPDILYADPGNETEAWLYLNQGDGSFKQSQLVIYGFPAGDVLITGVAAGDLNSDGCPDAVVLFSPGFAFVYNGDCSGTFKTLNFVTAGLGDSAFSAAIADVNGDGHPDLVSTGVLFNVGLGYGKPAGDLLSVLLNDGTGGLLPPKVYRGDASMVSFALADVNGDGKLDVVSANQNTDSVSVFLNDGKGGYGPPEGGYVGYLVAGATGGTNAPWTDFLAADLNGDGHIDFATLEQPRVFGDPWQLTSILNDGTGHFGAPQKVPVLDFATQPGDFLFADFRKTGKPDFLEVGTLSSVGVPILVYAKNNGDGTFAYPTVTQPSVAQGLIAAGDFNNDGKLDFVAVGQGTGSLPNSRYATLTPFLGRGDGTFTQGSTINFDPPPNHEGWPAKIVVGDFNRDGKLDVLVWIFDNTVGVPHPLFELLGNGDGTFQPAKSLFTDLQGFVAADLNKDGLLDLVELAEPLINWGYPTPVVYNIYLGQSDGTFRLTNSYQPYNGSFEPQFLFGVMPSASLSPLVADFNGDGNLDIAAFQSSGFQTATANDYFQVLLGAGDGTFVPTYISFPLGKGVAPGTAVDVNGDGRADLIELDSFPSSFHVIPAVPGPSFEVRLLADPVIGSTGTLRVTLALPSNGPTTLQLASSDISISIPSSVMISSGAISQDVPFQIGTAFNIDHVFSLQAQLGSEVHIAYGTKANPQLPVGFSIVENSPLSTVTVAGGTLQGYAVGVTSLAGYASLLNVQCVGLPPGAKCQFAIQPIDLPAGGQMGQSFSVLTPASIAVGNYPFQVQVSDGTQTQSAGASFQIGDFTLSVASSTISTLPTASTSFQLNSTSVNNLGQIIAVACSAPVASISCESGIQLVSGSQVQLVIQTQNTPVGNYTVTVTGTAGSVSHTATFQLAVGNVTATISPTSATIAAGTQSNFDISLTSQNAFAATFNYSCTNDVGTVVCQFSPSQTALPANGAVSTTLTLTVQSKPAVAPARRPQIASDREFKLCGVTAFLVGLVVLLPVRKRKGQRARVQGLWARAVFVLLLSALLASCGGGSSGGSGPPPSPPPPPPPQSKTIKVQVQASSGTLTTNVGTITVTVP